MAKKRTKYETNNFDIDSELDFPEFDYKSPKIKDDRKSVTKIATATLKGASQAILNPNIIRSTIRRSMPDAYGDALSLFDDGKSTIKSLYDHAEKEFKPAVKDLKNVMRRALPKAEAGGLPKKLSKWLKDWSAEDGGKIDLSAERQRNDSIALELGNLFKLQAEAADKQKVSDDQKDQFTQGLEQIRHRDQISQLDDIRIGINRLTAYQDSILSGYQKKSLELQFRQYFATVDLLETQKKMAVEHGTQLAGILKNTGLPEFVKIKDSERFKEIARNRFFEDMRETLFGSAGDFAKKFLKNISDNIKSKISDAANLANLGTSALDLASGAGDMMSDSGMSKGELAGGIAGNVLGGHVLGKGQDWLRKKLAKNTAVNKGAEQLRYRIDNAGPLVTDHLSNPEKSWGPLEGLRDFLAQNLPGTAPETKLDSDSLSKMQDPMPFTRSASKSLIEIIPGLLSRIHRELHVIRTGDASAGLVAYDYSANKFSTEKSIGEKLVSKLGNKDNKDMIKSRLDDLVKMVDPTGTLSNHQRETLRAELLKQATNRKNTDASVMTNRNTWRGAGAGAGGISDAFGKLLEVDENGQRGSSLDAIRKQRILSEKIRGLTHGVDDPRGEYQALNNVGQGGILHSAGLVDEKGNVSLEHLNSILMGGSAGIHADTNALVPGAGKLRRGRKTRSTIQSAAQPGIGSGTVGHAVVSDGMDRLADVIKANSSRDSSQTIAEVITRIEDRINKGILVFGTGTEGYDGEMPKERMGPPKPGFFGGHFNRIKGAFDLKNATLGDLFGGLTSGAISGAKLASGALQKGLGIGSVLAKQGFGLAKQGLGIGKEVLGGAAQRAIDYFGDVYVKGEVAPRLLRVKMEAGEYIDQASGQVLTSLKDIKGTVVDKAGNIVLQATEIKDSFIKGKATKLLSEVAKGAAAFLTSASGVATKVLGGFYGTAFSLAVAGLKTAKGFLPPYDVYVKGDREPVMFAQKMRLGAYFSKKSGTAIRHPSQIDGPVVDEDGNYVVSEEQLNLGLVDKDGVGVSDKVGRAFKVGSALVRKGLSALKNVTEGAKNLIIGIGQSLRDVFGGIFGPSGDYMQTHHRQLDVQLAILKVLQDRLPKRGGVGDADNDGDVDGSVADIIKKRKAEAEQKQTMAEKAKEQTSGAGVGGKGLLGTLAALFKGKKKGDGDDDGDTNISLDGAGSAEKEALKDAKKLEKVAKPTTKMGKLGALAKKGAGGLWKGVKGIGKFGLGLAGFGGLGLGGLLGGLGSAAAGVGSAALGAAGTIGSGLLAGAGGLLGGLAAVLSSPVTLAVLGAGALAYAGYKGYKYLTKKRLDTLSKVRYAQYGFSSEDVDNHLQAVFGLEDTLAPLAKLDGPTPSLDETKFKTEDLMKSFDVDPGDRTAVWNWSRWFTARFKPVFLGHLSVLKGLDPSLSLSQVDSKLSAADKTKYLAATALPGVDYSSMVSPFTDLKSLAVDDRGVKSAIEIAQAEIDKLAKDDKKPTTLNQVAAGTVAGGVAAGAASGGKPGEAKAADGTSISTLTNSLAVNAVSTVDAGAKVSLQSSVASDYLFTGDTGRLDALTSIRMKTYGLTTMDMDKVKALRYLEGYVEKNLMFSKDGATYETDIEALCERMKTFFGLTGANSPRGYNWMKWFKARFLPVYLNFATAVEKITKKKDIVSAESTLKAQDAPTVATSVYTTKTTYDGKDVSVWMVDVSPWKDYPLNMDDKSIDLNMEALTQAAKAVILGETQAASVKADVQANYAKGIANGTTVNPRLSSDTAGGAAITYAKTPANIASQRTNMSAVNTNNAAAPQLSSDGTGVRAKGDFAGGTPIQHPGNGTGGDINSLPDPQGKSGWQAIGPTLIAAAKMVGVDPKTLATIVGIESNFNPNARPINPKTGQAYSSAAGLFQFINGTWNDQIRASGKKYGIAIGTPATDARAAALMGAEFVKSNYDYLKQNLNRPITDTDVYLAHFMGKGGAVNFLKNDPNGIAATTMPKEAAANPWIYNDKAGKPRTFSEIYKLFTDKVNKSLTANGVKESDFSSVTKAPTSAAGGNAADAPATSTGGSTGSTTPAASGTTAPAGADASAAPQAGYAGSVTKTATGAAAVTAAAQNTAPTSATAPAAGDTSSVVTSTSTDSGGGSTLKTAAVDGSVTTTTTPGASGTPAVRSAPANFGGFNPSARPTSQEIKAQDQAQKPPMADSMDSINRTLLSSLQSQVNAEGLLKQIVDAISMNNGGKPVASAPAAPENTTSGPPRNPPAPVVSMSRDW